MSELDQVYRGASDRDSTFIDLKKLIEKQLKEIMTLQREVDSLRQKTGPHSNNMTNRRSEDLSQHIHIFKQENDDLKQQLTRYKSAQGEMEELVKERRSLLQLCEDLEKQVKDGHRSLEDALDKIGQMEGELSGKLQETEDIRKRITDVAILFEKKEIK